MYSHTALTLQGVVTDVDVLTTIIMKVTYMQYTFTFDTDIKCNINLFGNILKCNLK